MQKTDFTELAKTWAPRHVAAEDELPGLEMGCVHGDCVSPLLQPNDIVYIDCSLRPQDGDLVQFRISKRFADIQNAAAMPGQPVWKAGDPWIKLLERYDDLDMLRERHGHLACASLLAAEAPDDPYELRPVRNVRRNGQLLYVPAVHSGEVAANAATQTYFYSTNIQQLDISFANSGHNPTGPMIIGTAPTYDCTVIVTASLQSQSASGTGAFTLELCYDDTGVGGDATGPGWQYSGTSLPITSSAQNYCLQWQFAHSRSNRQTLVGISFANYGGSTSSCYFNYITLQAEYIKR